MCACWQEGSRHSRLTQPRADRGLYSLPRFDIPYEFDIDFCSIANWSAVESDQMGEDHRHTWRIAHPTF